MDLSFVISMGALLLCFIACVVVVISRLVIQLRSRKSPVKQFYAHLNHVGSYTGQNYGKQILTENSVTPKSISAMTVIYLPQISVDFPAFQYKEFRQKAENMLRSAFAAMTEQDISWLLSASEELKNQIRLTIEDDRRQGKRRVYQDVTIHRTEITNYQKQSGTCVITLQSAVGYLYYAERGGSLLEGSKTLKTQTRYNTEIVYIQDAAKLDKTSINRAVGIICPSCGAPVTSLGRKRCEYCGNLVEPVNHYAWAINRVKQA